MPALFAGALLCIGMGACGGASSTGVSTAGVSRHAVRSHEAATVITSSTIPPGQSLRGDGDADNPSDIDGNGDIDRGGYDDDNDNPTLQSYHFPDGDDRATFAYGHPPGNAARKAISSVVRRYYAAAAADNGASACALLLPSLARSVPESYGSALGLSHPRRAKTCPVVLSTLFRGYSEQLAKPIELVDVRVKGGSAQAILSSRTMRASNTFLMRQGGSWRLLQVLAEPLP